MPMFALQGAFVQQQHPWYLLWPVQHPRPEVWRKQVAEHGSGHAMATTRCSESLKIGWFYHVLYMFYEFKLWFYGIFLGQSVFQFLRAHVLVSDEFWRYTLLSSFRTPMKLVCHPVGNKHKVRSSKIWINMYTHTSIYIYVCIYIIVSLYIYTHMLSYVQIYCL